MFYLVQAGSSLQIVTESGSIFQTLTLPSGVTLDATRRARFAVLQQKVIISNAPSVNLWMDPATFDLFTLAIDPPSGAATLTAGAGTHLTGDYQVRYSYVHKIGTAVVNESPLSPDSATITLTASGLTATIANSTDSQVTGKRLYRTTAGGADFLFWGDVDDNTTTTFTDDTPDVGLGDLVNPDLAPPQGGSDGTSHLTLLTAWKNRLWGRADLPALVDHVLYTDDSLFYGWSPDNDFPAWPTGEDATGIVALAPRRDALGILKRNRLLKITGSSDDDFAVLIVVEGTGCVASDSVVVIRDAVYWLGADGVYRWDDSGVACLSRTKVDPWFTRDTVFDRSRFPDAVGGWNPRTNCYELQLVPAGGSSTTTWIAVDLDTGNWFGPHITGAFTPTLRTLLRTDAGVYRPAMGGSDGYLYLQNQSGGADVDGPTATPTAIAADALLAWMTQGDPDLTHYWGRVSLHSRIEVSGTLTVTPTVGGLGSGAQPAITFNLTLGREIARRLGVGRLATLRLRQSTAGTQFLAYGLDLTPIGVVGRR